MIEGVERTIEIAVLTVPCFIREWGSVFLTIILAGRKTVIQQDNSVVFPDGRYDFLRHDMWRGEIPVQDVVFRKNSHQDFLSADVVSDVNISVFVLETIRITDFALV